jgi:prevent-host-death family protein
MALVSIREFSRNPSAMFARVERGETIEVTKRGRVIAVLSPPRRSQRRYDELVARGQLIPAVRVAGQEFTHIDVPDDAQPLQLLLEMRESEP